MTEENTQSTGYSLKLLIEQGKDVRLHAVFSRTQKGGKDYWKANKISCPKRFLQDDHHHWQCIILDDCYHHYDFSCHLWHEQTLQKIDILISSASPGYFTFYSHASLIKFSIHNYWQEYRKVTPLHFSVYCSREPLLLLRFRVTVRPPKPLIIAM